MFGLDTGGGGFSAGQQTAGPSNASSTNDTDAGNVSNGGISLVNNSLIDADNPLHLIVGAVLVAGVSVLLYRKYK